MDVLEAIRNRRVVRQFKPEIIPDDILFKILEAARLAPSPFNTQPWEFIKSDIPLNRLKNTMTVAGKNLMS